MPVHRRHLLRLSIVVGALCLSAILFMLWQARGSWDFLLPFRGKKLFALMLVASTIAIATIVFQTLTQNRILTPSVMGLDALYLLVQIVSVALLGGGDYAQMDVRWRFVIDVVLMSVAAWLLFGLLLRKFSRDLFRLLLIGVVFGVFCRSLTSLFARMISPEDFAVFQGAAFAQFNHIDDTLLLSAAILSALCLVTIWRMRYVLDILMLGRDNAITLGVEYRRAMSRLMICVAALVAVSTALVGPVLFFGLLVSALTYRLFSGARHSILLPAAAFIAMLILVLGQTLFERALGFAATLSVVVELLGGLVFIFILLSGRRA
ncbi:iron chelate uptake ABC transporter family permease subunit [Suttonella sp. R2A3]|uniref:iron chelate uptake ABC transporter family permease subunit n=1 Tax=Suttonella sp. R2A3 TaxID=2908648 RepID=UPI001F355355|nr:iron chelate uptake ABC transporter family permease subunit [Suttonella sp. R2A3]UJF25073.1 iron chelate uptake ABC transporter family permease subunit [Suttonella sp. R2A3]